MKSGGVIILKVKTVCSHLCQPRSGAAPSATLAAPADALRQLADSAVAGGSVDVQVGSSYVVRVHMFSH
jgi:hypothetical protein